MNRGLTAGAIAAIVAAFVSLPLRSPSDSFLNSATVAGGVLMLGLAAGIIWEALARTRRGPVYYAGALVAGFIVVAGLAIALETQVDRMVSFSIPLAAIAFALGGALVPVLAHPSVPASWWSAPIAVVIAIVVGVGLAGQGDAESGELSLPAVAETTSGLAAVPDEPESVAYIVSDGSEATFTVREQLVRLRLPNDAVVRTDALSGEVNLDGRPSVIEIDLHTLSSDQRFRDRYIRSALFPNSPIATFTVEGLADIPDGLFEGETITTEVSGSLRIRDIEAPLTFEVAVRKDGDVLLIVGRTTFTWDELQIPPPTARPVVSVEDEVKVEILLQAVLGPSTGSRG